MFLNRIKLVPPPIPPPLSFIIFLFSYANDKFEEMKKKLRNSK